MRLSAKSSFQPTSHQTKNRSVHLLDRRPERLVQHLLFQNLAPQRAIFRLRKPSRLDRRALNKVSVCRLRIARAATSMPLRVPPGSCPPPRLFVPIKKFVPMKTMSSLFSPFHNENR